jgi:hypothetical protein
MSLAVVLNHVRNIYKPAHPVVIVLVDHACKQLLVDLSAWSSTTPYLYLLVQQHDLAELSSAQRKKSGGQYLLAAHDVVSEPNNANDVATAGPQCEETASTNCALKIQQVWQHRTRFGRRGFSNSTCKASFVARLCC